MKGMRKINKSRLVVAMGGCLAVGLVGAVYTNQSVNTWYPSLVKPAFVPPAWVFGPVWTMLFVLMGIALYRVWGKGIGKKKVSNGVALFVVQLVLNGLWSYLFFGLRNPLLALVDIVVLLITIGLVTLKFWRIEKRAGYLLLPYLFWVSFALLLNLSIVLLN